MKTIYLLKGLPASGKSTWAKQKQQEDPTIVRVNKDELRAMLHNSHWSSHNEKQVLFLRDAIIEKALQDGRHVIVDDTNLHPKHEIRIKEFAKKYNAQVEIVDFTHISPEECIQRDLKRPLSVGSVVIWQQYNQFLKPSIPIIEYNPDLSNAVICDLDGTLALFGDENPYERDFTQDKVNEPISLLLDAHAGHHIILVSGRRDKFRSQTIQWLSQHSIPYNHLFMRKSDDSRKDYLIKQEIYDNEIKGKYNIFFVLDDRDQVVRMWRRNGLTCLQVAEGNF